MKIQSSHLFFAVFGFLCVVWVILLSPRLLINRSGSLPYRFFVCVKARTSKRGDIVYFRHNKALVPQNELTKIVVGVAGDKVQVSACEVQVQEQVISPLYEKTRRGEKLTPIIPQIIPEGFLFLHGTHPFSLDSRYAEFGLVNMKAIQGRCRGFGRRT